MDDEQQLELIEECNVLVGVCILKCVTLLSLFIFIFQRRELNDLMTNDFDRVLIETKEILKV